MVKERGQQFVTPKTAYEPDTAGMREGGSFKSAWMISTPRFFRSREAFLEVSRVIPRRW
jgi:hypothetical protein